MADDKLHLTYRELAERLGTSPDAARMKAKRAVKAGRWRILPGNHPNDPVRVEMPADDIAKPEHTGAKRAARSEGERTGQTPARTETDTGIVQALQSAQARVAELTDLLNAEKDQHRAIAVELARASVQTEAMNAELVRLMETVEQLQDDLRRERRTWWQRLTGR